jgi:transglutaminase-like putative cysteine protease
MTPSRLTPLPVRAWVDVAVLTVLALLALLGFAPSFTDAGYLVAGAGGLLVGTAAGVIAAMARLGILTSALVAVVAYFVFGSALAMPDRAIAVVIPSLDTLSGLVVGAVFGWADIVTLTTPVAAPDYMGVLPYLCGLLVGLVSATIAGRWYAVRRRGALSSAFGLLAPTAVYVLSVLTGTAEPYLAALRGIAFAVIALVWMAWRVPENANASRAARTATLKRRLLGTGAIVTVAVVGGAGLGAVAAPGADQRFVLRDEIQPPFDPLEYPSPLSGFRRYTNDLAKEVLFTVEGVGGSENSTYLRTATMDTYSGKLWTVAGAEHGLEGSGTFRLVSGDDLPEATLRAGDDAVAIESTTIEVTIGEYRDVWMPAIGYPDAVRFSAPDDLPSTALRYNEATGILVDTEVLDEGDSYVIESTVVTIDDGSLSGRSVAHLDLPIPQNVPDLVSSRALEWAGGFESEIEQLREIETRMKDDGYLSHGQKSGEPSRAGHGADRMVTLLGPEYMIGDAEQYAGAFALMARSLGYPSRVVMGFEIPGGSPDRVEVTGEDVTAWAEVAFDGIGWVTFHPTPDDEDVPQDEQPKPRTEPLPQVRQPPPSELDQDDLVTAVEIDDSEEEPPFSIPGWVGTLAAAVLIPLSLYLIPVLVLGAIKRRRRRARRTRGESHRRAAGAWDELVDTYAELGYQAPRKATRIQLALQFEQQFRDELDARRREQENVERRAEGRMARAEAAAEAKRLRATGETGEQPAGTRLTSFLGTSLERAREASTWRPGVPSDDDPLPVLPGLRELAVHADESVFSGGDVPASEIDRLWTEADAAAVAARRSVSWFRRQLSRFRIRLRRDVVALAAAGFAGAARSSARITRTPREMERASV